MTDTMAVKGSSIAFTECSDANGLFHSHIYYQDPELYLREIIYNGSTRQWIPGEHVLEIHFSVNGYPSHYR